MSHCKSATRGSGSVDNAQIHCDFGCIAVVGRDGVTPRRNDHHKRVRLAVEGGATYSTTTDFGYSDGAPASALNLTGGQTLGITDGGTVYSSPSFNGWNLNGVSDQIVEVDFLNETLTFSSSVTALGFIVQPSAAAQASTLVQLSDGTQRTISANFTAPGSTQFIGFYDGGGVDSISLSFDGLGGSGQFALANVVDSTAPEPMSMALRFSGVTALGLIRRRHS